MLCSCPMCLSVASPSVRCLCRGPWDSFWSQGCHVNIFVLVLSKLRRNCSFQPESYEGFGKTDYYRVSREESTPFKEPCHSKWNWLTLPACCTLMLQSNLGIPSAFEGHGNMSVPPVWMTILLVYHSVLLETALWRGSLSWRFSELGVPPTVP